MKKQIVLFIGVGLLIIGSILAYFTNIVSDIPALAISAFGLGTLIVSIFQKAEKKDWVTVSSIIFVSIGAFCCAVASLSQDTMTKVIAAVIALITLLLGIFVPSIVAKIKKS